jgi:predicted nucleic acid-binding protein
MRPEDVPDGPVVIDTNVLKHLLRQSKPEDELYVALVDGHPRYISFATFGEQLALADEHGW